MYSPEVAIAVTAANATVEPSAGRMRMRASTTASQTAMSEMSEEDPVSVQCANSLGEARRAHLCARVTRTSR